MSSADLERIIASYRETITGEACSRSRVVDSLLDLRLDAGGRTDVIDAVDHALADLPGKTLVPAQWWQERLDLLELVAISPVEPVG
ncbi:MAG: hypothetical protein GWN79_11495 [Actinobacteria bacterium]|nr:hypothetical protein [Actinomycetota bacterium]NIS31977.1 hypothetical protein [Actinomycetota bacterium]NIT95994.1 hypothetical protein [Actinomycetota bacterium]NIU19671.1 hypothetical protein [Actinomycetota bacterium]NIU67057.1 hypothetical protein [Actinomycetota bacterium]